MRASSSWLLLLVVAGAAVELRRAHAKKKIRDIGINFFNLFTPRFFVKVIFSNVLENIRG